ncbi:MAG TPA: hypothetical protein VFZ26_12190 [Gemmatimonadales bacterium]
MRLTEPLLSRHPWVAALLLGTVATPAGVVLGWLLPRPFDAVVAPPLVLLDIWVAGGPWAAGMRRLAALALGIALTWLFYVLVARAVIWRLVPGEDDGAPPGYRGGPP